MYLFSFFYVHSELVIVCTTQFLILYIYFASSMRTVKVNGFVCKDPMAVNADDFFKAANLDKPKNTKDRRWGLLSH